MDYFIKSFLSSLGAEEKKYAPNNLFSEGNIELLAHGSKIAVVGSRNVSAEGIKRARIVAGELAKRGITVVSGLANGVDTIAHRTAIEFNGKTIAVLGTPLSQCSPISNKALLAEIKAEHLALSQFEEGLPVSRGNFPMRNKTMALISHGTIIVEATENSGTQQQAWETLRLGRPLFLLENVANNPAISWAKTMIDYGAIVLTRDNFSLVLDQIAEGQNAEC